MILSTKQRRFYVDKSLRINLNSKYDGELKKFEIQSITNIW